MKEFVIVEASNPEEARVLGLRKLEGVTGKTLEEGELSVELIEEKKGFLGFGKKVKTFKVAVAIRELTEEEKEFLDIAIEKIRIDGKFKIKVAEEGIMLKVIPPQGE